MQENNQLQKNVLEKIKSGEVQMTSRRFFIMKWLTLAVTSIFFLILGVYIFAYVIFLFVDNGLMIIPFGAEGGILKFIVEIPWTLVILGLVSLFLFSITSKTFYKIYKKPLISFYFSILMCVVISHLILLETGTMKLVKEEAYRAGLRLVPAKLLQFRDSQTRSIFVGLVVGTSSNSLTILDRWNNQQILYFDSNDSQIVAKINEITAGVRINAYVEKVSEQNQIKSFEIVK
jgi:hypothetical protein